MTAHASADDLRALLDAQRAAFARGAPTYRRRMDALAALRDGLRARQAELVRAVHDDFGGRSTTETLLLDLFPVYDQIQHARRHLRGWMRRRSVRGSWFLLPARAYYEYQPLGVVGVIGPWNYPFQLTLGPVVDAIATGNHVLLKPSEITPRSAGLIASIIAESLAPEYVACVTGGPEIGAALASLPLDHLIFTGSAGVGRQVLRAAAENLTPVTLELGGKSPAVVHESFPFALAVERVVVGKLYNAGQTCVAPDYVLIPEGREGEMEEEFARAVGRLYPGLPDNSDYTRIVTPLHYERLRALLADAIAKGARIVEAGGAGDRVSPAGRYFPPTLIFGATGEMTVMQEEIFGPILPVVTYRTLDEALAYVNARPRPLALYYFDEDSRRVDEVVSRTHSGGVTINDCIYHLGQHNLPFGGVGASGMGQYHGFDGFQTFSKKRGVMVQRRLATTALFRPPFGARKKRLVDALLRLGLRN